MVYSAAVISFNNLSIFQSIFPRENTRNSTRLLPFVIKSFQAILDTFQLTQYRKWDSYFDW